MIHASFVAEALDGAGPFPHTAIVFDEQLVSIRAVQAA